MRRRTVLKNLFLLTAGALVVPSCSYDTSEASIPLRNIKLSGEDEKRLAEVSETLIPKTAIPGAKDVYAHLFALRMIDDCYDKEQQQQFMDGLKGLDNLAKKKFDASFVKSTPAQREALLTELEGGKGGDQFYDFYQMAKALTIQGYLQSKYVLTNITKYELVPGRYNGFAPVKTVYHQI